MELADGAGHESARGRGLANAAERHDGCCGGRGEYYPGLGALLWTTTSPSMPTRTAQTRFREAAWRFPDRSPSITAVATQSLGNVSGTGSLVKTGEGVLRLAAVSKLYRRNHRIDAGTLEVRRFAEPWLGYASALAAGSVLTNAIGVMSLGNMIQLDGTASIDIGLQSLSLSNNISSAGGFDQDRNGLVGLGGNQYLYRRDDDRRDIGIAQACAGDGSAAVDVESGAD